MAFVREHRSISNTECLAVIGNGDLLRRQTLALFCSVKCPGTAILRTYDLVRILSRLTILNYTTMCYGAPAPR